MTLKRRKRARNMVRACGALAVCLLLSCVVVCRIHQVALNAVSPSNISSTISTAPHSLRNQLLRSKNDTRASKQMLVSGDTGWGLKEQPHNKPLEAASVKEKEKLDHSNMLESKNIDVDATKVESILAHDAVDTHNKLVTPEPTRESLGKQLGLNINSNNITLLRETLREMARNGSLEKAQEKDRRHNKEQDAKLRHNNKNKNTSVVKKAAIPTAGSIPATTKETKANDSNATSRAASRPEKTAPHRHYPSYFTNDVPLDSLKKRMNLLTPYTGCSIAAFQYNLGKHAHPEFNDCFIHCGKPFARNRGIRVDNAPLLLQANDTLFVQFNKLDHFVHKTMSLIDVDFVLMSGNEQKVPPISRQVFDAVVNNPHVLHWFMSNMDVYSHDLEHPKISPWPYGSNPKKLPELAAELRRDPPEKNTMNMIYKSGFSRATNPQRFHIPLGTRVPVSQYLRETRASKYILSPDGDRPECYRHYEAIGMGCMPITQMNAKTHSHLSGNAVFGNVDWNLTTLEATLPPNPTVNQRLIFEEYWMEYVERIVGRPLRWYDPSRDVHSSLAEIQDLVANDVLESREEMCIAANGAPFVGHRGAPSELIIKTE